MADDKKIGPLPGIPTPNVRKPGRPRAIPIEFEPVVLELYRQGYGYQAIARILRTDYNVNLDFSTVKRTMMRQGILPHPGSALKPSST